MPWASCGNPLGHAADFLLLEKSSPAAKKWIPGSVEELRTVQHARCCPNTRTPKCARPLLSAKYRFFRTRSGSTTPAPAVPTKLSPLRHKAATQHVLRCAFEHSIHVEKGASQFGQPHSRLHAQVGLFFHVSWGEGGGAVDQIGVVASKSAGEHLRRDQCPRGRCSPFHNADEWPKLSTSAFAGYLAGKSDE